MTVAVYTVPGLFGSGLRTAVPSRYGPAKSLVWISKTRLGSYLLDPLVLGADGITPPTDVGTVLNASGVYPALDWQTLDNAVSDGPHVSFDFAYDWRKDLRVAAAELANILSIAAQSDEWAVICHSAGAVVTLLAWAQLPANVRAECRRVIWIDPCIGGSYDSVRGMAGGYWEMYGFGQLSSILAGVVQFLDSPSLTPAGQQARLERAVASWPSLYQLMPNPGQPWIGLDPNLQGIYNAARWTAGNPFVQQQWLNSAATTQAAISLALAADLPPSVRVVNEPDDTMQRLAALAGKLDAADDYVSTKDGDGVVPTVRSLLPGVPTLTLSGAHQNVMGSAQLASRIISLIDDGLPQNTAVAPPTIFVGPKTLGPPSSPYVMLPAPFPNSDGRPDP